MTLTRKNARAVRRVIAAAVIAAGVIAVTSSPASAATTATFSPGSGVLTVFGDSADNSIAISRTAAGSILVNGGAVGVAGGTPTIANTALIRVFGQGGHDAIALKQANDVEIQSLGAGGTWLRAHGAELDRLLQRASSTRLGPGPRMETP